MWVEQGEAFGIDLSEVVAAAQQAYEEAQALGEDATGSAGAFYEVLEADSGYVEVCRSLYADR